MVLAEEAAGEGQPLTIEDVAQRSGAPKRFLEHILLELRNAGVLRSRRGRAGGYRLLKAPEAVSIGAIVRLIDGPMAPLPCLSKTAYQRCDDCQDEETCRIRHLFAEVHGMYLLVIESLTLANLLREPGFSGVSSLLSEKTL